MIKETIDKLSKVSWWLVSLVSFTGTLLMVLDCYTRNETQFWRDPNWYEKIILPFYFTFISNVMAVILSLDKLANLFKSKNFKRKFEVLTAVNLTATLIVYWSTLYTKHNVTTNIAWASNIFVHTLTPIFTVAAIYIHVWKNKEVQFSKNIWKSSLKNLLFLLAWTTIALIIYFSLDMNKSSAIYFFLDVVHNKWWETTLFIIFSPIIYYLFNLFFEWTRNVVSKKG